jgi:hypothetical protein
MVAYYRMFGDDPYIVNSDPAADPVPFSAWQYAEQRAKELCGEA